MKLLLTSNGLVNESICKALEDLVGKPRKEIKIAFIPNAGLPVDDFKHESRSWLINDLYRAKEFSGYIDIVSLIDLTHEEIIERLEYANVIFVGGGNAFYLSYCMEKSGLLDELPRLLESRVYAGISAGSMFATPSLRTASQAIKNPETFQNGHYNELGPAGRSSGKPASLVDFVVRPHMNQVRFDGDQDEVFRAIVTDTKLPLYAIDDQSAVKVEDDKIEVIGEGQWKEYN